MDNIINMSQSLLYYETHIRCLIQLKNCFPAIPVITEEFFSWKSIF